MLKKQPPLEVAFVAVWARCSSGPCPTLPCVPCTPRSHLRRWKVEALLVLAILDGSLPASLPLVSFHRRLRRAQGPCLPTGLLLLVDLLFLRILQVIELARRLLHLISLHSLLRLSACAINSCGVSVASRLPLGSVPTPQGLFTITVSLFFLFHLFGTGRNIQHLCPQWETRNFQRNHALPVYNRVPPSGFCASTGHGS